MLLSLSFTVTWFNFVFALRVLTPGIAASVCLAERVFLLLLRFVLLSFVILTAYGGGIMVLNAGTTSYRPIDGIGASMLMMFRAAFFADSRYDTSVLRGTGSQKEPVVQGFLILFTVVFWIVWVSLLISTLRTALGNDELRNDPARVLKYYKLHSGEALPPVSLACNIELAGPGCTASPLYRDDDAQSMAPDAQVPEAADVGWRRCLRPQRQAPPHPPVPRGWSNRYVSEERSFNEEVKPVLHSRWNRDRPLCFSRVVFLLVLIWPSPATVLRGCTWLLTACICPKL